MQTEIFLTLAYQHISRSSIVKTEIEMCNPPCRVLLTSLHKSWIHLHKLTGQTLRQRHSQGFSEVALFDKEISLRGLQRAVWVSPFQIWAKCTWTIKVGLSLEPNQRYIKRPLSFTLRVIANASPPLHHFISSISLFPLIRLLLFFFHWWTQPPSPLCQYCEVQ